MRKSISKIEKIIVVLLLILFLFIMPDVWGTLPKSQTDTELVEAAITRLIDAHNDDPTAHTGGNRALEAHRSYDILDHKAGSVLADKTTFREYVHSTTFENIADLTSWGTVTKVGSLGVDIYIEHGAEHESGFWYTMENPAPFHDIDYDFVMQMTCMIAKPTNNFELSMGWGLDYYGVSGGFGFIMKAGVLYAASTNSGAQTRTTITGIDVTKPHVYRVQYEADVHTVDYYVDGELVATKPYNETNPQDDGGPQFMWKETGTFDGYFRIAQLTFARSLVN